ncbi:MAG: hypothetical protein OEZ01_12470 [Candidatus Heimdallarchaeota archaeon]|nr:hypothetical protein [Candidatus Heimdallarchaeota archaeon]
MASLHDIPNIIKRAIATGANLELLGDPAIGKTSIIEQTIAMIQKKDSKFGYWSLYTPSLSPLDFIAVVPNQKSKVLTTYHNDRLPNRFDNPDLRGVLFLGERNNADLATNKALQKYINNEDMGGLQKPKGVIVISDSNKLEHRSGTVHQSLALLSRSRMINIDCVADETLKYFHEIGVHELILAFLTLRKEHVNEFKKVIDTNRYGVWANPRAWERLSVSMQNADQEQETLTVDEITGDIGDPVGQEFIAFVQTAKSLVPYETVVADPEKALQPENISDTYAVIAMLALSINTKDFPQIKKYIQRYSTELQVLFLRLLATNKKATTTLIGMVSYRKWFTESPELQKALTL